MAYHIETEKNGDKAIVWDGFEKGIAPSPHKGIANIQNANIATETGEVMCSYSRSQQSMTSTTSSGSLAQLSTNTVSLNITGTNNRFKGMWITVTASSNTGQLQNANYYVLPTATGASTFQLSSYYNGAVITGLGSGLTATITIMSGKTMGQPVAYAVETYFTTFALYRYYVLDNKGLVWVYDTANEILYSSSDNVAWFLPDTSVAYFGSETLPSGIAVLNGWLHVFSGNKIWVKSTVNLAGTTSTTSLWNQMVNGLMMSRPSTPNSHYAFVGHQGKLYYTDGNYLGSIFPDTSLLTGAANIQSYASYVAGGGGGNVGTISTLFNGSIPWTVDASNAVVRIPAVFFTDQAGTQPTNLSATVVYYIEYSISAQTFGVYAAATGGLAIDIAAGASGNQYFNTFYPLGSHSSAFGDTSTMTFTPQRLNLPYGEVGTSIVEIGNTILVGSISNVVYPWNQVDPTPSGLINLPENNTAKMLTVNQVAYMFTGNKGNIYVTDGSVASLVLKVPDYCAGIAGTQNSYYEPKFTWGGVMYLRGRVYFGILDQVTSVKDGNCGGVWSFYPTQNLATEQDSGLSLRLENRNSYETYDGAATILIPYNNQNVISPQYWSGWYPSTSQSSIGGIDFTNTAPASTSPAVIELDMVPVGTVLQKETFKQLEYKLASPLNASDSVTAEWRTNLTEAYTSLGSAIVESTTSLSGYFTVNLQGLQWVQIKITLTPVSSVSSSMCRLQQVRLR